MSLYILRWNPAIGNYSASAHKQMISYLKAGAHPPDYNWSVHDWQTLETEDTFIVQQVGTETDGIIMIGCFRGPCYEDADWRGEDKAVHYADMFVWDAFSCGKCKELPASHFERLFPEIDWHGGHSGVRVDDEVAERLIAEIQKVLIKKGRWDEHTYMDFVMADNAAGDSGSIHAGDFLETGKVLLSYKQAYNKAHDEKSLHQLLYILSESKIIVPMNVVLSDDDQKWLDRHTSFPWVQKDWKLGDEMSLVPDIVEDQYGTKAYPMFTNMEQLPEDYAEGFTYVRKSVIECIEEAMKMKLEKLVLDPFTGPFSLPMDLADVMLDIAKRK